MNAVTRWEDTLQPIPYETAKWMRNHPRWLERYLFDSFQAAFGIRPVGYMYSSFPDDDWLHLMIDGVVKNEHSEWAARMTSNLEAIGVPYILLIGAGDDFREGMYWLEEVDGMKSRLNTRKESAQVDTNAQCVAHPA